MPERKEKSDLDIKKHQIEILSIAEAFFPFSVLYALVQLDIFRRICGGKDNPIDLAKDLGTRPDILSRLLNAGVALKYLESKDGKSFQVTPALRSVLCPSAEENYLGDWLVNLDYFRDALSRLDKAVLQSGPTVAPGDHIGGDQTTTANFALAMHNYAAVRGEEIAEFLDLRGCRTLLDLGCGPGTYAFQLGKRNPNLAIYLVDLPEVLQVAREVRRRYEMGNEIHYLPLNALVDDIPGRFDVVLISNMLHCLGEQESRALLRKVYGYVNPGGSVVIQAQFLRDDRRGERWPVFLDLVQLCVTANGRNHSRKETKQWLEDAGFTKVESRRMSLLNTNSFIRAFR